MDRLIKNLVFVHMARHLNKFSGKCSLFVPMFQWNCLSVGAVLCERNSIKSPINYNTIKPSWYTYKPNQATQAKMVISQKEEWGTEKVRLLLHDKTKETCATTAETVKHTA